MKSRKLRRINPQRINRNKKLKRRPAGRRFILRQNHFFRLKYQISAATTSTDTATTTG